MRVKAEDHACGGEESAGRPKYRARHMDHRRRWQTSRPRECFVGEDRKAQKCLAAYIAEKYSPDRRLKDIEAIDVLRVVESMTRTAASVRPTRPNFDERLVRLVGWWAARWLSDVTA